MRYGIPSNPRLRRRMTWPWLTGVLICIYIIFSVPAISQPLDVVDRYVALLFNSVLGHSRGFDAAMAMINSKFGDTVVVTCIGIFLCIHIWSGPACLSWTAEPAASSLPLLP